MKRLVLTVILLITVFIAPAQEIGVHFEKGLSWEQIKQKAKTENKYIFVDCYASWCGPCRRMDKDIYPNDSVGQAMNSKFISVKVQMDTSQKDDEAAKAWYAAAHQLLHTYKIGAFPTFLFFSPDGKVVHRGEGYRKKDAFLKLLEVAQDPAKQYYTQVAAYRSGVRDYTLLPKLAAEANDNNDPDLAESMAKDYLHNYLDKLSCEEICTTANLVFMGNFAKILSAKDNVFTCFYRHTALVDTAMHNPGLSRRFVNFIISKEEITPEVVVAKQSGKEPDWVNISNTIKVKFGSDYVEENILQAKVNWYSVQKDWKEYSSYTMEKAEMDNVDKGEGANGAFNLNAVAWTIFLYSDNTDELKRALMWSDKSLKILPGNWQYLDTKANLLYKLGRKEEAIALENKAVEASQHYEDVVDNLEKMKRGKSTWLAPNKTNDQQR